MFDVISLIKGIIVYGALTASLCTTSLLIVLKLCGVLLLSWWWVIGIVPCIILAITLLCALKVGLKELFK